MTLPCFIHVSKIYLLLESVISLLVRQRKKHFGKIRSKTSISPIRTLFESF